MGLRTILTIFVALGAMIVGLTPAFVNGYPIIYFDTGVYAGFPETVHAPFPQAYAIAVWLFTRIIPLYAVPFLQSGLITCLLLIAFRLLARASWLAASILALALVAATQLPWLASWITTDWLGGCGILALFTYVSGRRTRFDIILLAFVASSCLVSTANLLVLAALCVIIPAIQGVITRVPVPLPRIAMLAAMIVGATLALAAFNTIVNHKTTLAMGSSARLFSKLVDDGLATPYLKDACGRGRAQSCSMANEVAGYTHPEEFLWGTGDREALADREDAWDDRSGKYARLCRGIIWFAPLRFARTALGDAYKLAGLSTFSPGGEDLISHMEIADDGSKISIQRNYGKEFVRFRSALQQRSMIEKYYPFEYYKMVTIFSYVLLPLLLIWAFLQRDRTLAALLLGTIFALGISTIVHGGLSLPIARYMVKNTWVATFVVLSGLYSMSRRAGALGPRVA